MALSLSRGAAIIGMGSTEFGRNLPRSAMSLATEAFKLALADARISCDEVDGIAIHYGTPLGVDFDQFAQAVGMNVRHVAQYWLHGRFVTTALQNAAFAVMAGLADVIACVTAVKFHSSRSALGGDGDHESLREGGGSHGEEPAFGFTSPAGGAAIGWQRYCAYHDLDPAMLYHVVAGLRAHARRNPRAMRREPFDEHVYASEPRVIDPLCRADCSLLTDGAVVALVTTHERAAAMGVRPAYLKGMQGMRAGRDEFVFAPRGLGIAQQGLNPQQERQPRQVFEMAGIAPRDVDALYTYDAFSPLVPYVLERFGHCAEGSATRFAADGETGPGGRLPVNTSGGLIGEAHIAGWNSIAEIVRQIRREAGPSQLPRADHLQWATAWGDSIIFGAEP